MRRLLVLAALCAIVVATTTTPTSADPPVGRYQEFGDATGFLNILPPGQDGVQNSRK